MRILFFDTETSGLDPQSNVILQLSYQIVDSDSWTTLKSVNHYFSWPENKARVSYGAIEVNGLTEEFLAGQKLSERKNALEEFVKDKDSCELLVAHNLDFDKKFILDFDVNTDGISPNKKTFLSFDFYLKQNEKNKKQLKDLKGFLERRVSTISNNLVFLFKDNDFEIEKKK